MAEDTKNENKSESKTSRRGSKPLRSHADRTVNVTEDDLDPNAPNENDMRHPQEVEGPTTDSSQWGTTYDVVDTDDARIIKEGDRIDVKTDDRGYATETVLREVSLLNTDRKSYILIATEGGFYSPN